MTPRLRFRWDGDEARPNATDKNALMEAAAGPDRITVLDFLQDVAWEAQQVYDQCLTGRANDA